MSRRLRVGLDGRAAASPAGGVRRYVGELVAALLALDLPLDLVALGGPAVWPTGVEHRPEPAHPPTNLGWTAVGVWRAARAARLDVYHGPAYTAPPAGVRPVVLTIHDVSYERHPEWYPYRRDAVRRWFYRAGARRAAIILTDSAFSQREIAAAYGIPADRIRVVPLGVSPRFSPAPDSPGAGAAPAARPRAGRYVLHVGDLHTRRNLGVALDAVIALRVAEPACAGMSLALVGVDRGEADRLRRRAEDAGHPQALHFVGSVDEDELLRWYRGASALVYPSVYEGFGLPLLEAMACGIAVVASDIPASAELAGDAAVLVPPTDARAWTDALRSVLVDPVRRTRLSDRGRSRAAVFTWERAARATWQAYRDAAAS